MSSLSMVKYGKYSYVQFVDSGMWEVQLCSVCRWWNVGTQLCSVCRWWTMGSTAMFSLSMMVCGKYSYVQFVDGGIWYVWYVQLCRPCDVGILVLFL